MCADCCDHCRGKNLVPHRRGMIVAVELAARERPAHQILEQMWAVGWLCRSDPCWQARSLGSDVVNGTAPVSRSMLTVSKSWASVMKRALLESESLHVRDVRI